MSALPGYLGALARAGDWSLPADGDPVDNAARPRPRARFEPDAAEGGDLGRADLDTEWGELAEEREMAVPPETEPSAPGRDFPPAPAPPPVAAPAPAPAPPDAEPVRPVSRPVPEPVVVAPPEAETLPQVQHVDSGAAPTDPVDNVRPLKGVVERAAEVVEARPAPDEVPTAEPPPPVAAQPDPPEPDTPTTSHTREVVVAERVDHEARPPSVAPVEAVVPEPERDRAADEAPTIVVEIDRIEVRLAADPVASPRSAPRPPAPGPSLADYLHELSPAGARPA